MNEPVFDLYLDTRVKVCGQVLIEVDANIDTKVFKRTQHQLYSSLKRLQELVHDEQVTNT